MTRGRLSPASTGSLLAGGASRRSVLAHGLAFCAAPAAGPLAAQGFAGLGTDAAGYAVPARAPLVFPRDHGAHPAFRIEWWYLTANLADATGRDLGLQWTLFRSALRPPDAGAPEDGWQTPQIWLAHAAVTTPERHVAAERFARGGVGQAGVRAAPFAAWLDEWRLADPRAGSPSAPSADGAERRTASGDALDRLVVAASAADFAYEVALTAEGPIVPQGEAGYSVKSPEGQASRYYSQPFYRAEGLLRLPEGDVAVTGRAWLDREWSSQPLADTQDGWDWISLHLDTGEKLMGFRLRDRARAPFTSATRIAPDGTPTAYSDGALTLTPLETARVAGRDVPVRWRAELPEARIDVTLSAVNPRAWMDLSFPYWEGPVRIEGSHGGRGYLEMTGYPRD
jgi:predicted secreted hydrolase